MPSITVVTISYNAQDTIETCIKSVLSQTYEKLEYIVIDGASNDETMSVVDCYRHEISRVVCEKDNGIADAMNKGIHLATGDYILFLHADDRFIGNNSLAEVFDEIEGYPDIVFAELLFGQHDLRKKSRFDSILMNFKSKVMHQATLCRRDLFERIGYFDEHFSIAMDYDFFLRAYRKKIETLSTPVCIAHMGDRGISSRKDWKSLKLRLHEEKEVHFKNTNIPVWRFVYVVYWLIYPFYKRVVVTLF